MKDIRKARIRTAMSLLTVLLLLSLGPTFAFAQTETGQVTIKATDPQGAVIPGAAVSAKSVERGTTLPQTTTNGEGIANLTNLQPGLYEVTVSAPGFAPFTQRVQVTVGGKVSVEAA